MNGLAFRGDTRITHVLLMAAHVVQGESGVTRQRVVGVVGACAGQSCIGSHSDTCVFLCSCPPVWVEGILTENVQTVVPHSLKASFQHFTAQLFLSHPEPG